jgi:ACR3 family arsenite efflux pump ArsB
MSVPAFKSCVAKECLNVCAVTEQAINPALALMLFVTFLQVPLSDLRRAFTHVRFLSALLVTNFLIVPVLVACLVPWLPDEPLIRLGVLFVLLTPCIDYVVTFSHLGRADARLLLAATPALLVIQMLLLPAYLGLFLGEAAAELMQAAPFIDAFIWLIAIPFLLAAVVQYWACRHTSGERVSAVLGLWPVPATALVLFVVIAAFIPQLETTIDTTLQVVPVFIAFAATAPLIGWAVSRAFQLDIPASRAVAFSAGTRNSLVILPLALAVPGAIPVLPAVIISQTLVELVSELIYIRLIPRFSGGNKVL